MDDFLLFTRRRWLLRRARTQLHLFFEDAAFETHPDKTQIGKLENGFDWLGLWFGAEGAAISPRALKNHHERRARLYEQLISRGVSGQDVLLKVRAYEARWNIWAKAMLKHASFRPGETNSMEKS
jgi:hypothetical protein